MHSDFPPASPSLATPPVLSSLRAHTSTPGWGGPHDGLLPPAPRVPHLEAPAPPCPHCSLQGPLSTQPSSSVLPPRATRGRKLCGQEWGTGHGPSVLSQDSSGRERLLRRGLLSPLSYPGGDPYRRCLGPRWGPDAEPTPVPRGLGAAGWGACSPRLFSSFELGRGYYLIDSGIRSGGLLGSREQLPTPISCVRKPVQCWGSQMGAPGPVQVGAQRAPTTLNCSRHFPSRRAAHAAERPCRAGGYRPTHRSLAAMSCLPSLGREPPAALGADPAQGTVAFLPLPGSSSVPLCESHHSLMFSLSREPSPGPL